jgi:hypothetical protein
MANWDLTKGLQNLRAQVNAAFPDRDKTSDGTIGDAAHQAGTSSHNPDDSPGNKGKPEWNGDLDANAEVRAWDMDSDLRASPATAQQVVDHIRGLPGVSAVLRYMIYNRKIYRAANGWKVESYDGPSPHTEHIHFSGQFTQAADNNTSFDYRLEEIPVALTDADKAWIKNLIEKDGAVARGLRAQPNNLSDTERAKIADAVWAKQLQRPEEADGKTTSAGAYQAWNDIVNRNTANEAAGNVIGTLEPKINQILGADTQSPKPPAA